MGNTALHEQRPLLLLSSRPWNSDLPDRLSRRLDQHVESITAPAQLTSEVVSAIDPQWIFVPHWSHLIPESIWGSWPTVIFHMTDLPYGRGGSPLQNLIQRGHSSTVITALRCSAGLDAGDVWHRLGPEGPRQVRDAPKARLPRHGGGVITFHRQCECPDGRRLA